MRDRYSQYGVGLIEVLVTLLILSTSLITLTAMQNRSLQFNQMAYFRSQANILAYDILDRIRINRNVGSLASYDVSLAAFSGATPPSSSDLVATDLFEWRREIDERIPGGKGGVDCDTADSICTITISWDGINSSDLSDEDESTSVFVYSARL